MSITSVDLAIQGELTFQKKVAILFPEADFMKDLLPIQVMTSPLI